MTLFDETIEEAPVHVPAPVRGGQRLRPYQVATVEAVLDAIDPFGPALSRVMYAAATGTGKTTCFAELIRRLLERKHRILVIAHRVELISQAYKRIKDHCHLRDHEIGMEIAETHASVSNEVIVGSIQTCYRGTRPDPRWRPSVIICDEAHHCFAATYKKLATYYGVDEGECIYIGCTATPKRTDKFSLFAERPDGSPVMLESKKGQSRPATYNDSVFQRLVYEYMPTDAIEDGWLVGPIVYTVQTDTSLDGVKTVNGDFAQGELEGVVDNARRTLEVISAWKRDVPDRPTLVFCAGVEHAHHTADLWRQAGVTAEAVDGTTETWKREQVFRDFISGKVQVITNYGIATEGTDLPNCACIVNLRPTKSWTLFVQMQGRGLRALPGVLDGLESATADDRIGAIRRSRKPDCAIVDVVDLYSKIGDICTAPAILDLPVKLDMQGHSLIDAKRMLDKFKEVKDRVIGECPVTYEELAARLEQVSAMIHSGARTEKAWMATDGGYCYTKVPPGYRVEMERNGDSMCLVVYGGGKKLLNKTGRPGHDMRAYLDKAAHHAQSAIDKHRGEQPAGSRGTLAKLSPKQQAVLCRYHGHSPEEVDRWTFGYAKVKIAEYMNAYNERRAGR